MGWCPVVLVSRLGNPYETLNSRSAKGMRPLPAGTHHTWMAGRAQTPAAATTKEGRLRVPEVLIVEDEPSIAEVVGVYLERAGFHVRMAADGETAMEEYAAREPDLVVLDVMLPGLGGHEVLSRIRAESAVPIIVLTSRASEADRIAGLEMGADDYVVKPFSAQELVSRVRAVLRRTDVATAREDTEQLEFDGLVIEPDTRSVTIAGSAPTLTAKEFDLLYTLAKRPRHVHSRDSLLEQVWGSSDYIDPSTVTVHIRRLREKIEQDPSEPRWITTVWGVGYRFEP